MQIFELRKTLLYAMMVCAFLALQLSGEISPIVIGLFYPGVLVSWFWEPPRVDIKRWARPWTALTLAVFAFTVIDATVLGELFLISGLNFVLFMATAKLFQRAEDKDYIQAMALSLLVLASAAVLNDGMSFGLIFAVYVVVATLGLTVQHVGVEMTTFHGALQKTRLEGAILWTTTMLGILVFAGAASFFFLFPRIGFGFFIQQSRQGINFVGFSDDVELGNHGVIPEDQSIAMRVVFPDGQEPHEATGLMMGDIHFRGISLDHYDGRSWSDHDDQPVEVVRFQDGSGYGLVRRAQSMSWEEVVEDTVTFEVNLEPMAGADILFSIGEPRGLQLPGAITNLPDSVFARQLTIDTTGELHFRTRSNMGVRYVMHSRLNLPNADILSQTSWPDGNSSLREAVWQRYLAATGQLPEPEPTPEPQTKPDPAAESDGSSVGPTPEPPPTPAAANALPPAPFGFTEAQLDAALQPDVPEPFRRYYSTLVRRYLQLPDGAITPRMAAFLATIESENNSQHAQVEAVRRWLSEELAYTTDIPRPSGDDANLVDEFMFEWERGHCEYFATSMVVLLRGLGIPARVVNGFLGGDYNDIGGFWTVRQANAHSWVEVYFPDDHGGGWFQFDPTPGGGAMPRASGWLDRLNMAIDSAKLMWFRWVVEYDLEKQFSFMRDTARSLTGNSDTDSSGNSEVQIWETIRGWMWNVFRNIRALSAYILLFLLSSWLFRKRALERHPWSALDWSLGAGWLLLSIGAFYGWWHASHWRIAGGVLAIVPPVAITGLAWLFRQSLFGDDSGRAQRRSRGSYALSQLYATILRDLEAEKGRLPVSTSIADMRQIATEMSAQTRDKLLAFLEVYEASRFGGLELSPEQLQRWRKDVKQIRKELRRDLRQIRQAG
jgi:transglutaminase-like putative cysteine protease